MMSSLVTTAPAHMERLVMVPLTAHHTSWTAPTMTHSVHIITGPAQIPSTIGAVYYTFVHVGKWACKVLWFMFMMKTVS